MATSPKGWLHRKRNGFPRTRALEPLRRFAAV